MFDSWQQWFLIGLLVVVFAAFVKEWISVEIVALSGMFLCVVVGILPLEKALTVFGHKAPLAIGCMFILSAALERTGVIEMLGDYFESWAGKSERTMLLWLMVIVAALSGFVINTPVVVVFLPIVVAICRRRDWKASRFLIPLSYAAIVGGTVTIIGTSTNLIAAGEAEEMGLEPFTMFEVSRLGVVFCAVTIVYMLTVGRSFCRIGRPWPH